MRSWSSLSNRRHDVAYWGVRQLLRRSFWASFLFSVVVELGFPLSHPDWRWPCVCVLEGEGVERSSWKISLSLSSLPLLSDACLHNCEVLPLSFCPLMHPSLLPVLPPSLPSSSFLPFLPPSLLPPSFPPSSLPPSFPSSHTLKWRLERNFRGGCGGVVSPFLCSCGSRGNIGGRVRARGLRSRSYRSQWGERVLRDTRTWLGRAYERREGRRTTTIKQGSQCSIQTQMNEYVYGMG